MSRARAARAGLASRPEDLSSDTQALLLRQLYLAHLERHRFRRAALIAQQMASICPWRDPSSLRDVAHHDAARALAAAGEIEGAVAEMRLASRAAPASRRAFHRWSLATLLHFVGREDEALAELRRAEQWGTRIRPLVRAHRAYLQLERGQEPDGIDAIIAALESTPARDGYGQFLLGMIHVLRRHPERAAPCLRTFIERNEAAPLAKRITLREELRRARAALGAL